MKKILSLCLVALAMLLASPAQAQIVKFGVKGGVNMSEIDWDGGVKGNKDNSTGFFFGPMAEFTLPIVGLGFDGALLYSQRGEDEVKQQGIEIPLNLKYTFGLGSAFGIYFAAGPDFFFNFKDIDEETMKSEKTQVALNLGAGFKLLRHLQLGVNYQFPMGDSFSWKNVDNISAKTKSWQVSAAYIF